MKKRLLALLLLTGLLSAALTGCGGGSKEQASEAGQTADGSTEARAQANEIVVGIAQDLDESLDPHLAVAAGTKEVMFNVFEGLVKPTPDGDLVPAVADHYEISEDQTTYTFTLREGVQFHNGDPVEMRDVTYSIERCADDSEGTPLIPALSAISSIQADDTTLTITLDQPDSEFLSYLTLAILPEDYPTGSEETFPIEEFDGKEFLMPYGRFDIDVNAALSPKKVKPNIRPCHVDDETVIRMVSKGLGITMMTEIMMRGRTHGVKTLPVSPNTGRELGIGMHLSKNTPEEIVRLRECVLDFTRELM